MASKIFKPSVKPVKHIPVVTHSNRFSLLSDEEKIGVEPPQVSSETTHQSTYDRTVPVSSSIRSTPKPIVWNKDSERVQVSALKLGDVSTLKDSASANQKRRNARRQAKHLRLCGCHAKDCKVPPTIEEVDEDSDSQQITLRPKTAKDILNEPNSDREDDKSLGSISDFESDAEQFFIGDLTDSKISADIYEAAINEIDEIFESAKSDLMLCSLDVKLNAVPKN